MTDGFTRTGLNRYLDQTDLAAWRGVTGRDPGSELVALDLFGLLQLDTQEENPVLIREHGTTALSELDRLATGTGRHREAASAVVEGLAALKQADPDWALDNPALFSLAKQSWSDAIARGVDADADEWAARLGSFRLVSEADLRDSLRYRQLPHAALPTLAEQLRDRGITVASELPDPMFTVVASTFPKGIAQAMYPEEFEGDSSPAFSLTQPAELADLKEAADFYTRNPAQYANERSVVAKLLSAAKSDVDVSDMFSGYYLQAFRAERQRGATFEQAAAVLAQMGVAEDEVRQLVASHGGSTGEPQPAPQPSPQPEPQAQREPEKPAPVPKSEPASAADTEPSKSGCVGSIVGILLILGAVVGFYAYTNYQEEQEAERQRVSASLESESRASESLRSAEASRSAELSRQSASRESERQKESEAAESRRRDLEERLRASSRARETVTVEKTVQPEPAPAPQQQPQYQQYQEPQLEEAVYNSPQACQNGRLDYYRQTGLNPGECQMTSYGYSFLYQVF